MAYLKVQSNALKLIEVVIGFNFRIMNFKLKMGSYGQFHFSAVPADVSTNCRIIFAHPNILRFKLI